MLIDAALGAAGGALAYGFQQVAEGLAAGRLPAGEVPEAGTGITETSAQIEASCSFSGDTEVATKGGEKPIEDIKTGDLVLAYNQDTKSTGYYPVKAVLQHQDKIIVHLTIDDDKVTTTPEHPFFTKEDGWAEAGDLRQGMHVQKADGTYGAVKALTVERTSQEMYNLTVGTAHTFFVGDGQWLAHNSCPDVFADLTRMRQQLGLEADDVLARLDINGQRFYGVNASGTNYPRPAGVTFQSMRHAEGDALNQAIASGIRADEAILYVDQQPCGWCRSSLAGYARALGLNRLFVYTPDGLYGSLDPITGKFRLAP